MIIRIYRLTRLSGDERRALIQTLRSRFRVRFSVRAFTVYIKENPRLIIVHAEFDDTLQIQGEESDVETMRASLGLLPSDQFAELGNP